MLRKEDINVLMNQLRFELTGASEGGLKSVMYEVMDEFFRDTSCWRETIPFTADPSTLTFPIAPSEGQIIRLEGVADTLGNFVPALMPEVGVVQLQHAVNSAQQLYARVVNNVCLPLTREGYPIAPDWVLQKWHLAVKEGIIGNMMNQGNMSYTNKEGALYHLRKFRQHVANVRSATLRANTVGAQSWRFPQSYRTGSQKGGVPPWHGSERTF